MNYDAFMNRPSRLHDRILHKADEVAFKFEVCTRATGGMGERVQTSPENKTSKNYAEYIDANNKLTALVNEYNEARDAVTDFLYDNLEYEDADLLEWKYVNAKDLQGIADVKGLAYQTVKNKVSAAERRARQKFINSVPKRTEKYWQGEYDGSVINQ